MFWLSTVQRQPLTRLRSFLCLLPVLLSGCAERSPEFVLSGPTMGTTYTVRIVAPPPQLTAHVVRSIIEQELERVDVSMSGYRNDSEIARFNATHSNDWVECSPELAHVMHAALEISRDSGGAFDVTVTPLVRLWGFGPEADEGTPLPGAAAIARARTHVGSTLVRVQLDPPAVRKEEPSVTIDLNGIAPGYAVDRIATRLEENDVTRYLVDIGGEIRARGRNKEGKRWRVAVEDPSRTGIEPLVVLNLSDQAIATSGDYRQYVEKDGQRFSHTIDPRTGAPIRHRLASVVVAHELAMYADAWATAYNVLGPDAGYELAARLGMAAMFISGSSDGSNGTLLVKMTPSFEPLVKVRTEMKTPELQSSLIR